MDVIKIVRKTETKKAMMGELYVNGDKIGPCLEQPWKNNKRGESCIPPGEYLAYLRDQEQSNSRWNYNPIQLIGVHERDYIQIHIGNYPKNTRGCILPGKSKGRDAVWNSKKAFNEIVDRLDKTRPCKVVITYE
ncbi:DUF5675 family protein [Natroniella sp. ANB-PHB2]|uniref:DUF5675 family protein n=1 Tax=Natroniella sp. ANB-PHB2 TaxID=3384444 RepID=UPI0038D3C24C